MNCRFHVHIYRGLSAICSIYLSYLVMLIDGTFRVHESFVDGGSIASEASNVTNKR